VTVTLRGLVDTSKVILLGRITDPSLLPDEPVICAITLAELSVGPPVSDDCDERAARQAHLQLAESDFDPLPFYAAAALAFGGIAADLRQAARNPVARAYKALIAATAISTRLPLFTCTLPAISRAYTISPFEPFRIPSTLRNSWLVGLGRRPSVTTPRGSARSAAWIVAGWWWSGKVTPEARRTLATIASRRHH